MPMSHCRGPCIWRLQIATGAVASTLWNPFAQSIASTRGRVGELPSATENRVIPRPVSHCQYIPQAPHGLNNRNLRRSRYVRNKLVRDHSLGDTRPTRHGADKTQGQIMLTFKHAHVGAVGSLAPCHSVFAAIWARPSSNSVPLMARAFQILSVGRWQTHRRRSSVSVL